MTSTFDYAETARRVENAFTTTLDTWKSSLDTVTDQFRGAQTPVALPRLDATEAVERQFAFIQRLIDVNHDYARNLAEVANTLNGVTRQQIESVTSIVREHAQGLADASRTGVDGLERTVTEQAEQAEQAEREVRRQAEAAEREARREAAKAERQQRKQAEDEARERYADLTKSELSEEAGKRKLPRTGTVDELVARLVEDDTK